MSAHAQPAGAQGARRVLVIDDNKSIHEDIRKVLAPADGATVAFEIDSAYQGQEGLEKLQAARAEGRPYALAFVDVRMPPGWDGVETVGHLWRCDPSLQVVLCTASSDFDWNDITEKIEAADRLVILRKPFDNIEVLQLAHALTRKWQLQRDLEGRLANLEQLVGERNKALTDAHAQREQMEVALRLSQKLESVGRLANGIAHEMNTPLQFVVTNLAFLHSAFADIQGLVYAYAAARAACADEHSPLFAAVARAEVDADAQLLGEDVPAALTAATTGVERMAALVRSMKEFAQPEQQQRSATDINDALTTTLTVSRNEWHLVADVNMQLTAGLQPLVCMRGEINQVFLNLIVNAAHSIANKVGTSGAKGTIFVKTGIDERGALVVTVADTGTGIREDIRDKIFDPFFTTKDVGRGCGQGLATAWNIVEKHGGSISVDSIFGEGATFEVTLPMAPVPAFANDQASLLAAGREMAR